MSTEFTIRLEPPWNGSHVVSIVGELDIATVHEVSDFLTRLDGTVTVDCAGLSFVDASGIRAFLQAAARLEHLQLINVHRVVRRVLDVTDTTSLLEPAPASAKPRARDSLLEAAQIRG
jgi:anti-anti-sigma factor